MEEGNQKVVLSMISLVILGLLSVIVASMAYGDPNGADLAPGESSRGSNSSVQTASAQAGNVTALNIDQTTVTGVWQGYFGNVTGQIILSDSGGNNFYDWSKSEVSGEIFATRIEISDWSNINCTNSTQWELEESILIIPPNLIDGINETYRLDGGHDPFLIGSRQMQNCRSARPYNSSGMAGDFWNILLNSDATNTVYASILADNSNAFDDTTVDFELMVPVNRTKGQSTYYFYAELD